MNNSLFGGFGVGNSHAFRTAAAAAVINRATDDLGTLGGLTSIALAIKTDGAEMAGAASKRDIHREISDPTAPVIRSGDLYFHSPDFIFDNPVERMLAQRTEIRITGKPFKIPIPQSQ